VAIRAGEAAVAGRSGERLVPQPPAEQIAILFVAARHPIAVSSGHRTIIAEEADEAAGIGTAQARLPGCIVDRGAAGSPDKVQRDSFDHTLEAEFTESKAEGSYSIYLNSDSDLPLNHSGSHVARQLTSDRNNTGIQQQPGRRQQMINSALQTFANKVQQAGRISFGDVKRLKRDILPDGISSRDEAELLLILAQSVGRTDRAFGDWLVATTVDFVVWGMRPTGTVDAETAAWLSPFLVGQRTTKTMRRLARELTAEADHGGDPLPSHWR
jgi:hypothetical protein